MQRLSLEVQSAFRARVSLVFSLLTSLAACSCVPSCLWAADDLRYSAAGDGSANLFQFPPETPEDLVEAARIAINLDRPSDARGFLRQLIERDPQAPEMLALRRRFGLSMLIDFRRDARLQPEAGQLLKQMQSALPQLSAADLSERAGLLGTGLESASAAEFDLMAAGSAVVPVLLSLDRASQAGRAAADILESLAPAWRHDLAALLPNSDQQTRLRIYELLAGSAAYDLQETLLRQRFTATDPVEVAAADAVLQRLSRGAEVPQTADAAAASLLRSASELLADSSVRTFAPDPAAVAVGQPAEEPPPLKRAGLLIEHALAIQPTNAQGLLLKDVVAAAATAASVAPAESSAGEATKQNIAVLRAALDLGQASAAINLLKSMDPAALAAADVESSAVAVLRQANSSPDARVRTLAAELAVRSGLENRVSATAVRRQIRIASGRIPRPEAVVIMADGQARLLYSQLLEDLGFRAEPAGTGPEGFQLAASQLQCEFVVLSLQPSRWSAAMTLANLRADLRTRLATVILVGPPAARRQAESLVETYGNAVFLEEPVGAMTFASRLQKLRLPPPVISAEERLALQERVDSLLAGR